MRTFLEWLELNESPLFKGSEDRLTADTVRSVENMDALRLYRFLHETSMRARHQSTARDAAEAAAYVAWRYNNRLAEMEGDLYDPQSQLGGPRCRAGVEFEGVKN